MSMKEHSKSKQPPTKRRYLQQISDKSLTFRIYKEILQIWKNSQRLNRHHKKEITPIGIKIWSFNKVHMKEKFKLKP
jgi:hypothetical protein